MAFFLLADEITQVKEAIPWVRCASGNVSPIFSFSIFLNISEYISIPDLLSFSLRLHLSQAARREQFTFISAKFLNLPGSPVSSG